MDESEDKQIRMNSKEYYNEDSSGIYKFNKPLSDKKIETLVFRFHIVWCYHLKNTKSMMYHKYEPYLIMSIF